jgi:protein involved in polysaccharide export with SLBB domain
VQLLPYDNVLILPQPDWELQRTVVIAGEVQYPGRYALRTKTERVGDIVKRAGGITREGHADGVTFYRARDGVGRIGIELPNVIRNPRHRDNLILQEGDSIFIPRYSGVVNVQGQVNSPVAVAYVPGQTIDYYIRAAGGPAARADMSRAYVTQPNGKVEAVVKRAFAPDVQPRPRAGGTIFVPERDPRDVGPNYAGTLTTIVQILSALVATIAVARTF